MEANTIINPLVRKFRDIRKRSENICQPLEIEDYVVQPIVDVSPPKWHLGHTTWFFETFILIPNFPSYEVFDDQYNFVFNSYYETIGARVIRTDRGNLSRPSVSDIYRYRAYVDEKMTEFLNSHHMNDSILPLLELGLNHEQQHQELLITDIKYILGHNPLFPIYKKEIKNTHKTTVEKRMLRFSEGIYEIGFEGLGFCFDNELNRHKVYLHDFGISNRLVTNREYLEFMESGGYSDFRYWHSDGWNWVKENKVKSPLYWHKIDGKWMCYTLGGLEEIDPDGELCHVNFYEASAYASWKGMRLPTEQEWEVASPHFEWGKRWEWTNSAYLPYPGFKKEAGAVGEYNGKFMVNQMVLRGASVATPPGHSRDTYRNFFQPDLKWQFTGIRLAK
ncbi:ergothioneine biosynthesis protein EgtB [Chryseobacterium taichungense]|uniref:Ergothioneine biosynthesis protein EgtB n=1 Tax=Chryseobacterium taichungense TaxID=295069 RepID=A0A1H7XJ50_9FLAO|nr:ergothioneine biosynthesis protein EgtB [Chryseobacterium taichungense]SEM33695.1 ergothioneine biosynthesis protein EgtB [Chryseobacterium taichungense]